MHFIAIFTLFYLKFLALRLQERKYILRKRYFLGSIKNAVMCVGGRRILVKNRHACISLKALQGTERTLLFV